MSKLNYTNGNKSSPFKKGRFSDVVKPKRSRYTKFLHKSDEDTTIALAIDIVQVLADVGICLRNVHTIAKKLTQLGWIKSKKIEG